MSLYNLLETLANKNVQLDLVEGTVSVNAPKGAVTPEIMSLLKDYKQELIAHLERFTKEKSHIVPTDRNQELMLSFAQQRLWMLDQIDSGKAHYNIPGALRLKGNLDYLALNKAFTTIFERHESVRTCFTVNEEGQPIQLIRPPAPFTVSITDLSGLDENASQLRFSEMVAEECDKAFDLTQDLMLRAQLIKASADEHVLLVTMHHIASDGWSMSVLINEFSKLYSAFSQGLENPLEPHVVQYADYSQWQRNWLQGEVLEQQMGYWEKQLTNVPVVHSLPLDQPRPPSQTFAGSTFDSQLAATTSQAFLEICKKHDATLFMGLHTAFSVLLARYSNATDIVIGSPIANREQPEVAGLIGFFTNTLVLRSDVSNNPSFVQLLNQSKEMLLAAYTHQQVPFEKIVERLQPERSLSHSPLFQVMLVLQNNEQGTLELPGLTLSPVSRQGAGVAKYDITLNVFEADQGLSLGWEYNTDLFEHETIARMAAHFELLLKDMVATPERSVFQAQMLSPRERDQLLVEWNQAKAGYPKDRCIHQLFEAQVQSQPKEVAVTFEDEQLTYEELNQKANQLAHYLIDERQFTPETLVGICVERSLDTVIGILAILKTGGAYVPLDPQYPEARLAYMLDDAKLTTVLTQSHLREDLPVTDAKAVYLDDENLQRRLQQQPTQNPDVPSLTPDHLAYVIYTSGSTGKPKGVMVPHRGLCNLSSAQIAGFELNQQGVDQSRVLQFATIAFDAAASEIWTTLNSGSMLILCSTETVKSPVGLGELVKRFQVTHVTLPPALLTALDINQFQSVSTLIVAGESCPRELADRWSEGRRFINAYGPTESTVCASMGEYSRGQSRMHIGKAIQNLSLLVINPLGALVPPGVAGELYISGVGVSRGYLNQPDLTAEKFVDIDFDGETKTRCYRTGDLVRYLPDGNLEFLGRIDRQVKVRGFRIELGEVENALRVIDQVKDVIVLAKGAMTDDKRLVAYVVTDTADSQESGEFSAGAGSELIEELRQYLSQTLPGYMTPNLFVLLPCFPLTPNGKLDHSALPEPDVSKHGRAYVAPRTETEKVLCGIWQEVLGVERVGVKDNFFQLGGHSLLVVKVISRLQQKGISMSARQLFAAPLVIDLARELESNSSQEFAVFSAPANLIPDACDHIVPEMLPLVDLNEEEIAGIVSKVPGGAANVQDIYPLGPLQEGILFHHMMSTEGDAYVLPQLYKFNSREAVTEFIGQLQFIIDRHDILRTAVLWQGLSLPVQVVCRHATVPVTWLELPLPQDIEAHMRDLCAPEKQWIELGLAPLFRVQVSVDPNSEQYFMLLQSHHVISDHVGLEVIQRELALCKAGKSSSLPEPVPYREFISHVQHQALQNDAEAFFTDMLGDVDEPTIPFGLQDINGDGSRIIEAREELPDFMSREIRRLAKDLMISPSALFHTASAMVIASSSGRDDVTFGTVLSGRLQGTVGAEQMLGVFINTLPLRVRLKDFNVLTAVRKVQQSLLDLLSYEQMSLAVAQRCSRVPTGSPLFTAMFNYRHSEPPVDEVAPENAGNDNGMEFLVSQERTNYPITFTVDDFGVGFALDVKVDNSIDAKRVLAYFNTAIAGLIDALQSAPELSISSLPIVHEIERQKTLVEWNNTQIDYPEDLCIHELFEKVASANPDATAVVFSGQHLTYNSLNEKANQLAHYLIEERQAESDCLVGICVERSLDMMIAILAVLKSGGAYVPLDPEYPETRLSYILENAQLTTVLTQTHLLKRMSTNDEQALCLDSDDFKRKVHKYSRNNPDKNEQRLTSSNLAYVIYTSGSTGNPKGVMIEHRSVTNLATTIRNMGLTGAKGRWGWNASCAFDASVKGITQLMLGTTLHILSDDQRRDPSRLLEDINDLDVIDCTPTMVEAWFLAGIELRLPNLIIGGEPISQSLWERLVDWQYKNGKRAVNVYGPTECTVDTTGCVVAGDVPHMGKGLANSSIYVLNDAQLPVPIGTAGQLHIGGVGLARGYFNRPDLTAEKFILNPYCERGDRARSERLYKTGDIVRWSADGKLEFLGRIDDQVKIRGFRIELGEIENRLKSNADVTDAVVVAKDIAGINSPEKRLIGYVVIDPSIRINGEGSESTIAKHRDMTDSIRFHLAQFLPDYMVPSAFVFLEELPLTPNGKIDRKALPEPDLSMQQASYVAASTEIEKLLCGIWEEVLGVESVGLTDNFFQLGGHSLLIIQIISRMQQNGLSMSARQLYTTPILGELAKVIESERSSPQPIFKAPANLILDGCEAITPEMLPLVTLDQEEISHIVSRIQGGAANVQDIYPLGPLQEGILYHHTMSSHGDVYVLPSLFKIKSREAVMDFIDSLQFVIDRHDVLRTAIFWQELSVAVQVVSRCATLPVIWKEFDSSQSVEEGMRALCAPDQQWIELGQAPLVRLQIAVDPVSAEYFVLLQSHHIISDHVGLEIIQKEIALYQTGRSDKLPIPVPYREFVAHAQYQASQNDAESFFATTLGDVEEPTAPFNLLDNNGDGSQILDARAMVPAEIASEVRILAKELEISPATVFHTAWAMVVGACSSRSDVVFGTVLSGRLQGTVGSEKMLGVFINTLPLRVKLENCSVADLVNQVHSSLLDLLPYEQASLSLAQRCSGVKGSLPLFTALLNYRHSERLEEGEPNPSETDSGFEHLVAQERANYPFGLSVDDFGDAFMLSVQVNDTVDVGRIVGYVQTAVAGLTGSLRSAPKQPINSLSVLPQSELDQLLVGWSSILQSYPKEICLHELFEKQVDANPKSIAVVFENQQITYQRLNEKANQLAHYLRNKKQVKADTLVGICIERSLEMVVGMLAILKAGGAYVPLDPEYPEARLHYILKDAELTTVLTQSWICEATPRISESALCIDSEILKQDLKNQSLTNLSTLETRVHPKNLAYVIYTSGTTGNPKGVMIEHRSLVNLVVSDQKRFHITTESSFLNPLSIGFDAGNGYLWNSLCAGAALYLESPVNDLFDKIEAESITHAVMAASMLSVQNVRATDSLKVLISGGDVCDPRVLHRLEAGTQLFNVYGPTENTVTSTCQKVIAGKARTIGKPIANVMCLVLDQNNRCVPIECVGELCIGGDGLARGYLNRPDLTAEKFVLNPFYNENIPESRKYIYKTGDLARWLPDGNLEFMGRVDQQVKIRGFRIELGEIENSLKTHPDVHDAIVLVRNSKNADKQLVAYVTTDAVVSDDEGIIGIDRDVLLGTLRYHLSASLPNYMVPSSIMIMDQFPMTPHGKIDRSAFPEPDTSPTQTAYVAPRTEAEEKLCDTWKKLLSHERVGVTDNFFELGGNSLIAVRFVGAARKLGLKLTVANVVTYSTIEQLAKIAAEEESDLEVSQDLVVGEVPLSTAQSFFLNTTLDQPNWGNAVKYFDFQSLDLDLFQKSLLSVIAYHDALRAKFVKTESGWKQVIIAPEEVDLKVDFLDFTEVREDERVEMIDRCLLSKNGEMELENAPLIEVRVFYLGEKGYVGRINFHHLLVDQYSLEIITDDWGGCFGAISTGSEYTFPQKSTSTRAWINGLIDYVNSPAMGSEIEYWLGLPWRETALLPVDRPGLNTAGSNRDISISLSREQTDDILEVARQADIPFANIIIAALALTLAEYSQGQWIPLRVLESGRSFDMDLDVSRTVGWLCVHRTLMLRLDPKANLDRVVRSVDKQIKEMPNKGLGLELLQCYHADKHLSDSLQALGKTEVFLNYQGVTESAPAIGEPPFSAQLDKGEYRGGWISPHNVNNEKFTCNARVLDGRFCAEWRYSENLYEHGSIVKLTDMLLNNMIAIAKNCGGECVDVLEGASSLIEV